MWLFSACSPKAGSQQAPRHAWPPPSAPPRRPGPSSLPLEGEGLAPGAAAAASPCRRLTCPPVPCRDPSLWLKRRLSSPTSHHGPQRRLEQPPQGVRQGLSPLVRAGAHGELLCTLVSPSRGAELFGTRGCVSSAGQLAGGLGPHPARRARPAPPRCCSPAQPRVLQPGRPDPQVRHEHLPPGGAGGRRSCTGSLVAGSSGVARGSSGAFLNGRARRASCWRAGAPGAPPGPGPPGSPWL